MIRPFKMVSRKVENLYHVTAQFFHFPLLLCFFSSLTPILGKEMNEARINGWVVFVCSYERTPISNHKNHTIVSQRQTISSLYDPKRPLWKLRSILCTYTLFNQPKLSAELMFFRKLFSFHHLLSSRIS